MAFLYCHGAFWKLLCVGAFVIGLSQISSFFSFVSGFQILFKGIGMHHLHSIIISFEDTTIAPSVWNAKLTYIQIFVPIFKYLNLGTNHLYLGTNHLYLGTNHLYLGTNQLYLGTNHLKIGINDLYLGTNDLYLGTNDLYLSSNTAIYTYL